MNQHLAILGLGVAHADLDVLPPSTPWADVRGPKSPDPPAAAGLTGLPVLLARRGAAIRFALAGTWLPGRRQAA